MGPCGGSRLDMLSCFTTSDRRRDLFERKEILPVAVSPGVSCGVGCKTGQYSTESHSLGLVLGQGPFGSKRSLSPVGAIPHIF
jgi:hypothetical protein